MARISEIEEDGGDPILKAIFDKQRELFGGVLNPSKVLAHCPPILKVAGLLGQSIEQSGQLPEVAAAADLPARGVDQRLSVLN